MQWAQRFLRKSLTAKLETVFILLIISGAMITLGLGGTVNPSTIKILHAAIPSSKAYGEPNSTIPGYLDNLTGWFVGYRGPSANGQIRSGGNVLLLNGSFQRNPSVASIAIFKSVNVNITSSPLLEVDLNLTTGLDYGIRFFANYSNGTQYNVWWEGSPLDHRPGIGFEHLRINMEREAILATGHSVDTISKVEIYVEDLSNYPRNFQFLLSKLSFASANLLKVSSDQYRAIYFDLTSVPQNNASWYLNKVNLGVSIQASPGSVFSLYIFDGPILYASTSASQLVYNSLTSFSEYTFYPNIQPQTFSELLPVNNASIVFVASSGTLQNANMSYVDWVFLPATATPSVLQQSVGLYYVSFIFFLFLLPVGLGILIFREFLSRNIVPRASIIVVLATGLVCRVALAATTAHAFDMNVYLASIRGWFQFRTPLGSLGPTLPFTYFLYWTVYSPYALLQLAGFQDTQFLGHAAGLVEAVFAKLFPILMDVLTFSLLLRFRRNGAGFVWSAFYFLNPLSIFVSSVWGQYEAATMAFIVWGIYLMSRQEYSLASLTFVVSGMIELVGFLPYALLLLKTARMKLYKTLVLAALVASPAVLYLPETDLILRVFLGLAGFIQGQYSQAGIYTLLGNFPQLSIISQFKPLLLSESIITGAALLNIYRRVMNAEKIVFYTALSSVSFLFFSSLLASWVWLLSICLLYAILRDNKDLGAFMLVFGTTITFLEVSNTTGSAYLILGNVGFAIQPAVEAIQNQLKIFAVMATALSSLLLFYMKYGGAHPFRTLLRTSAITLSFYLLLYFWLGVYPQ